MELSTVVALILAFVGIVVVLSAIRVVQQSECVVIERLGSFNRTLKSGLHVIVPFIDQARYSYWIKNGDIVNTSRIDLRETVLDVPSQMVITRDNVSMEIDALLYIQIVDPMKAFYEISNLPMAVAQLAQTSLRNVIGEMDLDETLASRDRINVKLKAILDEATDKWGTHVNRVELKNITPAREIQLAMEKQMQAERERRAKVLEAEGDKQARISRSEGVRQEQINLAEGEAQAQIRRAEGEAQALRSIGEAKQAALAAVKTSLGNDAALTTQYMVATNYLEQFGKFVAQDGDKVFVPYEASATLGAIGSLKELLSAKN